MPDIDIKTLLFLFAGGNIFILFFFLFYIILDKVRVPVINVFISAKILLIIVLTLFALRNIVPDFYSISIANVLFFFGLYYETYCIVFARQQFRINLFFKLNLIPVAASVLFMAFRNSPEISRIVLSSIITVFIYLIAGIYLLANRSNTKIQRLAGFFNLIVGILFASRAIWALNADSNSGIFTNNIQTIAYTFLFLCSLSWGIVLLLILKEKDELQIKADNLKLKELNLQKDNFFSIIAHDLKNPISAVANLGHALLEEHKEIDHNYREKLISLIYESSKKTYNLLINLLQWASSESGSLKLNKKEINIYTIIENNLSLARESIQAKNIGVEVLIKKGEMVYADYHMVDTVIRNLLANAIKYSRDNGQIVFFSKKSNDNRRCIYIEDNGPGISEKALSKIFDIDSRYSTRGTNDENGTGLGLKLCKEFVEKNNGIISVNSAVNKGSTFYVCLPIKNI